MPESLKYQRQFRKNSKSMPSLEEHHNVFEQQARANNSDDIKGGNTMKQLGLLVLGSALMLSFGWAQTDSTSTDTSTAMTGGTMDFATFDADADGLISADELGQGLLTQYDTNADGSLDETEFAAISAGSSATSGTDSASTDSASTDTSTDSSSTDSASTDSSTSTDTATTDTSTSTDASSMTMDFATFDADADGAVTPEELGQGMLASYDANADSGLDETEFAAVSMPSGTMNTQ
jgi:Ca2+-binding EF-hand superfamily protein